MTAAPSLTFASDERPLWEAAIAWCDPQLVDELRSALADYKSFLMFGSDLESPMPNAPHQLTAFALLLGREAFVVAARRHTSALEKLEADLRTRIAAGTLLAWGVRVEPTLERHRTQLSCDWGHALRFDWPKGSVAFGSHRFVGVVCAPGPGRAALAPPAFDAEKLSGGRPSWPFAELVAIARSRQRQRPAKREAKELLATFRERHPDLTPPAEDSIKTRLAKIYRAARQSVENVKIAE